MMTLFIGSILAAVIAGNFAGYFHDKGQMGPRNITILVALIGLAVFVYAAWPRHA